MGGDHLRVTGQRGVHGSVPGRGLVREHVYARPHVRGVECGQQGLLVHDLAPGRVDQHRVRLHRGQELGIDHARGVGPARHVQRHDVAGGENRGPIGQGLHADVAHALAHIVRPRLVLGDDCQTAGGGAPGHLQPDGTHPDDAQSRAVQAAGLAVGSLVPLSGPHVCGGVGDVAVDGEHQPQRQFGDGYGVASGDVAHEHAELRGALAVDCVRAGAGPDHQSKVGAGLYGLGGHPGAAHDQHVEAGDMGGETLGGDGGLQDADVAAGAQPFDGGFRQAVAEQDPHALHLGCRNGAVRIRNAP